MKTIRFTTSHEDFLRQASSVMAIFGLRRSAFLLGMVELLASSFDLQSPATTRRGLVCFMVSSGLSQSVAYRVVTDLKKAGLLCPSI